MVNGGNKKWRPVLLPNAHCFKLDLEQGKSLGSGNELVWALQIFLKSLKLKKTGLEAGWCNVPMPFCVSDDSKNLFFSCLQ